MKYIPEFDNDGYPSEDSLVAIRAFNGTPKEFVEFTTALYRNGFVSVEQKLDDWGRDGYIVDYVTGGWSGCESVMGEIKETMFSYLHWAASYRGGKDVFHIPADRWDNPQWNMFWGDPKGKK